MHICRLIEISAMVLVQSVFPGGEGQGSEGPAQRALLLGSYAGSPSDLIS